MRGSHTHYHIWKFPSILAISGLLTACGDTQIDVVRAPLKAEINTPISGQDYYQGQVVEVVGRIADPNPGGNSTLEEVTVTATLGTVAVTGHPAADGTVRLSLPTRDLVDGDYVVSLSGTRAYNDADTKAAMASIDLLPNMAPEVSMISPSADTHVYAERETELDFLVSDPETPFNTWSLNLWVDGVLQEIEPAVIPESSDYEARVAIPFQFVEGRQELALEVIDGYGKQVVLRDWLDVGPANTAPNPCQILAPSSEMVLQANNAVLLEALVQDADQPANTLTFTWTIGQTVVASGSPSASGYVATELPDGLPPGSVLLSLTAQDELGSLCEDRRTLNVLPPNSAPEVEITYPSSDLGAGAVVTEEDTLLLNVVVRDQQDMSPLATFLSVGGGVPLDDAACALMSSAISPQGLYAYEYRCSVLASSLPVGDAFSIYAYGTDSQGLTAYDRVLIQVRPCVDADGDGYSSCREPGCDDDPKVNPGQPEICDGLDNNCDNQIDKGATDAPTWYRDYDQDGFGNSAQGVRSCTPISGYTLEGGDCNDQSTQVHPAAQEVCGDRIDNNCNGVIDEAIDADGDGFIACNQDCDDTDPSRFPGNVELCDGKDNNCDGAIPDSERDGDKDGAPACAEACDDDASAYPGHPELCNGKDDDCDGQLPADELDSDRDGALNCQEPACADDPTKKPDALEVCDGRDNDCDGVADDGLDRDNDGFVPCIVNNQPGDCNDADPSIYPGALEKCDGVDANCDGVVDTDPSFDQDRDGVPVCLNDCNDKDVAVKPGLTESFDGKDNNCDGERDNVLIEAAYDAAFVGEGQRQFAGGAVAGLGDINRDGFLDYAIGVPRFGTVYQQSSKGTTGNGRVYIFLGDGKKVPSTSDLKSASVYLTGELQEDELGAAIVGLGDINGDGSGDFAVGARYNRDIFTPNEAMTGAVYVVYGCDSKTDTSCFKPVSVNASSGTTRPDPKELVTTRYSKLQGEQASGLAGSTLAPAGDVNGDGLKDLLIAAPAWQGVENPSAGAAYLVLGQAGRLGTVPEGRVMLRDAGEPYPAMMSLANATVRFEGRQYDTLGTALADRAGDVNGDGYADLVMGAPNPVEGGRAYVFYGRKSLGTSSTRLLVGVSQADALLEGEAADRVGAAVALADLDDDGFAEVIVGAPDAQSYDGSLFSYSSGRVSVVFGSSAGLPPTVDLFYAELTIEGDLQPEQLGTSLSAGQDVNGDGVEDLLIGAPGWSTPEWTQTSFRGRAYLLLGGDELRQVEFLLSLSLDASFAGGTQGVAVASDPMNSDRVGTRVALVGELYKQTQDPGMCSEIMVSTPYFDTTVEDVGKVYLISGRALP